MRSRRRDRYSLRSRRVSHKRKVSRSHRRRRIPRKKTSRTKSKRRRRRRKSLQRGGTLTLAEAMEEAQIVAVQKAKEEEAAAQGLRDSEQQQEKIQRGARYGESATYWKNLSPKEEEKMKRQQYLNS